MIRFERRVVVRVIVSVFVALVVYGDVFDGSIATAQRGDQKKCGQQTICMDFEIGASCVPLATTLPSVDPNQSNFGYGFKVASDACGAKRCWLFLVCPCGPPLGVDVCRGEEEGASCSDGQGLHSPFKKVSMFTMNAPMRTFLSYGRSS